MVLIKNKSKTGIFLVLFLCILIFLCSCSKSSYLDKKAAANKAKSREDISVSSTENSEKNQVDFSVQEKVRVPLVLLQLICQELHICQLT